MCDEIRGTEWHRHVPIGTDAEVPRFVLQFRPLLGEASQDIPAARALQLPVTYATFGIMTKKCDAHGWCHGHRTTRESRWIIP
ncbi:MAG: hypothetical protein KY456_08620 [Chloroflexi bacterium]|nr:hypothetical protein [Chloroflexota bacterium]